MSENDNDITNVEAWADVIDDILILMPLDQRAEVLQRATIKQQARTGGAAVFFPDKDDDIPPLEFDAIAHLKSLVIQVFARDITNDHSPKDAAKILFAHHRHGRGSRLLSDYLPRPPQSPYPGWKWRGGDC
jgi:hypothetical protein